MRLRVRVYENLISRASLNRRGCYFISSGYEIWQLFTDGPIFTKMPILRSLFLLFSCYIFSVWAVAITSLFPSLLLGARAGNLVSSLSNVTSQDDIHPLKLSESSHDESTTLNLTAIPPLRYDVKHGQYTTSMYRRPATAETRTAENPGVSYHNWNHAVNSARQHLATEQEAAGASFLDQMPGREFQYVAYFDRPAIRDRRHPRTLIFTVTAKDIIPHLRYIEVEVVLLALVDYGNQWTTGRSRDQVRMCRFDLHWEDPGYSEVLWIASGTAVLVVPAADVQ